MTLNFLLEGDEDTPQHIPPLEQVPLFAPVSYTEEQEFNARARTAEFLLGTDPDLNNEDLMADQVDMARSIFSDQRMPVSREKELPAVLVHLKNMLSSYDRQLVADATQIRTYVTNKLLEETADPDPKIRLRAYELLGKVTEVALFTERSESTVQHKTTPELESLIRDKLNKIIDVTPVSSRIVNE